MSDDSQKPVAVITGGARGIGAASAAALAEAGWRIALLDSGDGIGNEFTAPRTASAEDLERTAELCRRYGPALAIPTDVRSAESVATAVEATLSEFGRVDAAIAAAGRIAGATAWETPDRVWRELIDVNLHGVRHLAEAVIPRFVEADGPGRFIGVASASAGSGLARLAAYGATKGAVVSYVRGLAADLRGTEVTANVISPGSTDTEMLSASAEIYGLEGRDSFAHHQLIGRILRPEEIAAAIRFVCGPDSSALTGAVIPVDGGMTV